jgi:hypothetical protein
MSNADNSELHNKAAKTMTDAAMLLLLRTLPTDAVTFCAFEKIRAPTTAEKRRRQQLSVCETVELV